MKFTDKELKPSRAYYKIDTFCGEWDTKEGAGKWMKNALYVKQHGKRHLSAWSDVEQRKRSSGVHIANNWYPPLNYLTIAVLG